MNTSSSSMTSTEETKTVKGYRFHPTEEELINHYLHKKMLGYENQVSNIAEVDICKHEPWDLPMLSKVQSDDRTWYFFGRPNKYRNSSRANRKTKDGYWKVTGKYRSIKNRGNKKTIGIKKNLVFYRGHVPKGVRTNWVIHEYHPNISSSNGENFVICRLKQKTRGKIVNSTIDEGESSPDVTSDLENPVTKITEIEPQYMGEFFSSNEEDFNPSNLQLHQPETYKIVNSTIDEGESIRDVTSDLENTVTEITEIDMQFREEFFSSNGEDFNPLDLQLHQSETCMEQVLQSPSVWNLQNTNSFTDNYIVPSPQFGAIDMQDNTTKWMNSSISDQDVYFIDGTTPTLPCDSSPSESFSSLLVDDTGDTEEVNKWVNSCFE